MLTLKVWWTRHRARVLSRHSNMTIVAKIGGVPLGEFLHGREIKR